SPSTCANVPGATSVSVMCGRLPSPGMSETAVVTAFVEAPDGRILLLRRAPSARTYAGRWSGVSGYLEEDDAHERALLEVAEAAELGLFPLELGRALAAARPSMGAVGSAVGRVLAAAREPDQVVAEAQGLLSARERAPRAIAVLLQPDLTGTVMTHSASATVREALLHSPPDRVVCTVSEPIGEGRGFSEELSAQGLTVELVADEDAEEAVSTVDLLLIGADTVFRDGSL